MEFSTAEWEGHRIIYGQGPLDSRRPVKLTIGFHGADSTPENMLIHGSRLPLDNAIQIFPQGPVDAGEGLWSWWQDGPRQKETVREFLDFSQWLFQAASRFVEEQAPGQAYETRLWGFSQGAAAALVTTLLGSHPVARTVSICGFLPELPEEPSPEKPPARILGIYGTHDEVVPSFLADFALEEMRRRGHVTTVKELPQGHEISESNLQDLRRFFEE